jgi:hypothetical protein
LLFLLAGATVWADFFAFFNSRDIKFYNHQFRKSRQRPQSPDQIFQERARDLAAVIKPESANPGKGIAVIFFCELSNLSRRVNL